MLKLYSRLLLCSALFSFISLSLSAQISVTASQGTAGPTTYPTLKAAFDAINAGTHKGNINVSVTGNTTETAAVTVDPSGFGPTLYTSIVVKPATGVSATITGSIATYLLLLDSTQNVTFDGSNTAGGTTKNLTLENTNTAGLTVALISSASSNVLKNLILKGAAASSAVVFVAGAGATATGGNNNNLIENNDITKSSGGNPAAGIYNTGTAGKPNTGNIYRGNRIFDFSFIGFVDGNGTTGFSNNTLFERNEIFMSTPATGTLYGIQLSHPTGITNMTISRNNIHDLTSSLAGSSTVGIDLYDAASVTIVNNFVSMTSAKSYIRGIAQETGTPSNIKIYHNTVRVSGTTDTLTSFAFLKNYTSTGDDIKNNLFVNTRTASGTNYAQYAWAKTSTGTYSGNNNNIVSSGNANNILASVTVGATSTQYTSLATFQTATSQDAASISVVPTFVSATDLHLSATGNSSIDNKGGALAAVTVDYDNETRSTTTPDIGADEFTATATCTNPVITAQSTSSVVCENTNLTLTVTATGTNLTYQWRKGGVNITGATSASYTQNSITTAVSGTYDVVVSSGTCSVTSTGVVVTVTTCTAVSAIDADISSVSLLPNIVKSNAVLRVQARRAMSMTWHIVDANGKTVMSFNRSVNAGRNDFSIDLSKLSGGLYQLMGTSAKGKTETVRLLKQ